MSSEKHAYALIIVCDEPENLSSIDKTKSINYIDTLSMSEISCENTIKLSQSSVLFDLHNDIQRFSKLLNILSCNDISHYISFFQEKPLFILNKIVKKS